MEQQRQDYSRLCSGDYLGNLDSHWNVVYLGGYYDSGQMWLLSPDGEDRQQKA